MELIPAEGVIGDAAIREAATTELHQIMELVRAALIARLFPGERDRYASIEAFYQDRVVTRQEGRLFSYPYAITESNQVELGTPEEVIVDHKPVHMREAQGVFLEAVAENDKPALKYQVRVVRAGLSGNRNYYTDVALREAVPLFNNVRVFVKADDEHLQGKGKDFNKLIGRLMEAKFMAGQSADTGEIRATLELLESASPIPEKIYEAYQRGMAKDLFGFSIDAWTKYKNSKRNGVPVREALKFTKVDSVDLIIEPGAGGEIINMIEAINTEEQNDMSLRERMIEAVKKANQGSLPDRLDINDDEQLEGAYREALAAEAAGADDDGDAVSMEQLNEAVRMSEARSNMRAMINASNLPAMAKDRVRRVFEAREKFSTADVETAIKDEREYLGKMTESGSVRDLGDADIHGGEYSSEKISKMLDGLFDPKNKEVISVKECYIQVTGDRRVTGNLKDCDRTRMREALGGEFRESLDSTSWANVLGDAITRRMIADYVQTSRYDIWRNLVSIVPVNDFRTNERTRVGGYGDLPAVAQSAPYAALSSPTDEKATYAVTKRGGTEDVTLEMIKNDDVGSVQRIPMKLSRAAKRTLSKFVLDFIRTNPAIYDGDALFHANHGNLGSDALAAAALSAARLLVLKQTELSSADRVGIPPVNLWVPFDLEETGFDLFRRQTNNETDFVESLQMLVWPVWYWTDANDWAMSCDPNEVPTIEVGFLDGNQEPELFVQDNPTVGSLFTHDKITWKIRHIYGGNVLDYRGMFKAVVA